MKTPNQKSAIDAFLAKGRLTRRRRKLDPYYDQGGDSLTEYSEIEYLANRELKEICEELKRGGYDKLG